MSKPINVPYNAETKHIYETYVKVAMQIAERNQRERNKTAHVEKETKDVDAV